LNFQNPKLRAAAILKTVKSPYLRKRLTDFDEIWHADADWPYTGDRPLKFPIFFKNQDSGGSHLENLKNNNNNNNNKQICIAP